MPWTSFVCGSSLVLGWFLGLGIQLKNDAEAMPTNANIRSSNHLVLSMPIEIVEAELGHKCKPTMPLEAGKTSPPSPSLQPLPFPLLMRVTLNHLSECKQRFHSEVFRILFMHRRATWNLSILNYLFN